MRIHHDAAADALYVRFAETPVVDSEEVRPGIVVDYDVDGRIVAVEILDAAERVAKGADFESLNAE